LKDSIEKRLAQIVTSDYQTLMGVQQQKSHKNKPQPPRLLFVVNEAYFFMSHRLALAKAAQCSGFEVHVAAPEDHVWAPDGFSTNEIVQAGFTFHNIPLSRRGKNPFQDIVSLIALVKLFFGLRPDLLHLLTIKPVVYGGIAARLAGLKSVVCTVTGLGQVFVATGPVSTLLRQAVILLYRLATKHKNTRVIVQNKGDRSKLVETGAVSETKVRLIRGSGVSTDAFKFAPDDAFPPVVVLPSRLIWEKGVGVFAEAARILKKQSINARFALVGDTQPSNPRAVPADVINEWVEEGILEWWGRQTDMPRIYEKASIVCLPSIYGEGVPKVLIEASASGRAIVTADNPGCTEIVQNDINGLVVPPNDPASLAQALKQLILDSETRRAMGERGREIVLAEFSEEQVISETLQVYKEVFDHQAFKIPDQGETGSYDKDL
jgi:glycosyltransferase involved in cell wall biosynthesis